MISMQQPLGSGFGHDSTSADVLAGIDLGGKVALVTGGHSGLGLETTRALASAGAEVIVASRDVETASKAVEGITRVSAIKLDLADLSSVSDATRTLIDAGKGIDILINNAGIMACPEQRVGPGWEAQFATNHLGHFALTLGVLPLLTPRSRIVAVSSLGHHGSPMRWDDVQFTAGYDKWLAYCQSKTAIALFAFHLDKQAADRGIRAFSLHPGKIFTPLQRHLEQAEMIDQGWMDEAGNPTDPDFKSIAQGAATQLWIATSPSLHNKGGVYCEDCDIAVIASPDDDHGVCAYACDPDEAERLWHLSLDLTGIAAPLG